MRIRKKIGVLSTLIVIFLLLVLAGGCGAPETAAPASGEETGETSNTVEPVELHFSHFTSNLHHLHVEVYDPFVKEVEEKTEGRVKIYIHPGATLTPANENYDATATGVVDLAHCVLGYTPGRFPLADVADLPFMFSSSRNAIQALTELFKTEPEFAKQFDDVKILWFGSLEPGQFLTTTSIKTLDDIKGLKLRSPGPMQNKVIEALGGIPVSMPITDVYDSMDRGIINGAVTTASSLESYRLSEVVTNMTMVDIYTAPQVVAMNKDSWNKISPEDQSIIEEIAGNYGLIHGESYDNAGIRGYELAEEEGIEINHFTPEQLEEAKEILQPLVEEWIEEMEGKGYPARDIYEKTLSLAEQYR